MIQEIITYIIIGISVIYTLRGIVLTFIPSKSKKEKCSGACSSCSSCSVSKYNINS